MEPGQVHQTINRLVEGDHERHATQTRLREYSDSHAPPLTPGRFESMEDFLKFYSEKRSYHNRIKRLEAEHANAQEQYDQARRELSEVLPQNVPLSFTYDGDHEELKGSQFTLVNMARRGQGQIAISRSGPEEP